MEDFWNMLGIQLWLYRQSFLLHEKINRRTFYIDLRFKLDVVCIVLCCYLSSPKTLCIPSTVISHVEPDCLVSLAVNLGGAFL